MNFYDYRKCSFQESDSAISDLNWFSIILQTREIGFRRSHKPGVKGCLHPCPIYATVDLILRPAVDFTQKPFFEHTWLIQRVKQKIKAQDH